MALRNLKINLDDERAFRRIFFQKIIAIHTLFSLFIGKFPEAYSPEEKEIIEGILEKAMENIFKKSMPAICSEGLFLIEQKDKATWILWLFKQGLTPCSHMKTLLNECYSFCRVLPLLITREISQKEAILFAKKAYQSGEDRDAFKGTLIMDMIEESSLTKEYADIFLSFGKAKKKTTRQQHLRKSIIKELKK